MIINENKSNQGYQEGSVIVHRDGTPYKVLAYNGHNYLLKNPKGEYIIALGFDNKSHTWAQGKYWRSNEKGAWSEWRKKYSVRGAYGSDIGESLESDIDKTDLELNEAKEDVTFEVTNPSKFIDAIGGLMDSGMYESTDPYGKDFEDEVLRIIKRNYGKVPPTASDIKRRNNKIKVPWFLAGALTSKLVNYGLRKDDKK